MELVLTLLSPLSESLDLSETSSQIRLDSLLDERRGFSISKHKSMLGVADHALGTQSCLTLETVVEHCFEWVLPTVDVIFLRQLLLRRSLEHVGRRASQSREVSQRNDLLSEAHLTGLVFLLLFSSLANLLECVLVLWV